MPRSLGIIVIILLASASCSRSAKFDGRLFLLVGNERMWDRPDKLLVEYHLSRTSNKLRRTVLAEKLFAAAVNPAATMAAYSDESGLHVRDLVTGKTTRIVPRRAECIRWSPKGDRFAFTHQGEFYFSTPTGPPEFRLSTVRGMCYRYLPDTNSGDSFSAYGDVGCPYWLTSSKVALPYAKGSISSDCRVPSINTITIIDAPPCRLCNMRDAGSSESLRDVCPSTGEAIRSENCVSKLIGDLANPDSSAGTQLTTGQCLGLRFAAPSCRIYSIAEDRGSSSLALFDNAARHSDRSFKLGEGSAGNLYFHPDGRRAAIALSTQQTNLLGRVTGNLEHRLLVVDTLAGTSSDFAREVAPGFHGQTIRILSWVR